MDVPDLLEVPEVCDWDPDVWGHLLSTGFCLRMGWRVGLGNECYFSHI